jgi:hypothetical protein
VSRARALGDRLIGSEGDLEHRPVAHVARRRCDWPPASLAGSNARLIDYQTVTATATSPARRKSNRVHLGRLSRGSTEAVTEWGGQRMAAQDGRLHHRSPNTLAITVGRCLRSRLHRGAVAAAAPTGKLNANWIFNFRFSGSLHSTPWLHDARDNASLRPGKASRP